MRDLSRVDRLVAEHVFGLFLFEDNCECSQWTPGAFWVGDSYHAVKVWQCAADAETANEVGGDDIPSYSSNISDAWSVVNRMKELGFHIEMECSNKEACHHRVSMTSQLADFRHGEADEGTMPLALSLAALKALGVEVGDE